MGCGSSTAPTGAIDPAATNPDPTIPGSYPTNPAAGASTGTNPMASSNAGQPATSPLPPTRVNTAGWRPSLLTFSIELLFPGLFL